ncbi:hypothetical protein FHX42_002120 [Saccharopolyspora lacisalsi]|uniref:Uncharacterized protein n=1 Tax=Halosaccharopolyspora lacisalsi TaxID=1000566 RepID=A0A839DUP7_9PSEU|nr:hypothetical protein [Halosaccharopolyspora lacisalsi]MBA8824773.1 hypothetical protein [Halosaccharopolyspora lacisalsi]
MNNFTMRPYRLGAVVGAAALAVSLAAVPATATSSAPSSAAPQSPTEATGAPLQVRFSEPLTTTEVGSYLSDPALGRVQLVTVFPGQPADLTVGIGLQAGPRAAEAARRQLQDGLAAQLASERAEANPAPATTGLLVSAQQALKNGEVAFTRAKVSGARESASVQRLLQRGSTAQPTAPATANTRTSTADTSTAAQCAPNFVPVSDAIGMNVDGLNLRNLTLDFGWTPANLANLKCHGPNVTYEHDFAINNYDGQHFFGSYADYWSSTMPDAYLDTTFDDPAGERYLTIGTSDALKLQANFQYSNYIRTGAGNTRNDWAKLQGQRGHRIPGQCHGTFCIFADATQDIHPAWVICVPDWPVCPVGTRPTSTRP